MSHCKWYLHVKLILIQSYSKLKATFPIRDLRFATHCSISSVTDLLTVLPRIESVKKQTELYPQLTHFAGQQN